MQIRYIGTKECSVKLISGGQISGITPGKVISVPIEDYNSLLDLATRTPVPEWQVVI